MQYYIIPWAFCEHSYVSHYRVGILMIAASTLNRYVLQQHIIPNTYFYFLKSPSSPVEKIVGEIKKGIGDETGLSKC
jgi:hypothetical protein